ncbi:lysozyme inhibitor LprI family protein [Acinetobacter sp. YH12068_T]|uniref:lysozyme inhibitor LprI family protein n=1 Tax=Acinetobacter sp. YH12068_T TaxID=2929515 RepID=UPI0035A0EE08
MACYEKELQFNKTKLNQTYQKLYNTMNEEGQKILETSQKNWLLYKNSHCNELVSYLSSGV